VLVTYFVQPVVLVTYFVQPVVLVTYFVQPVMLVTYFVQPVVLVTCTNFNCCYCGFIFFVGVNFFVDCHFITFHCVLNFVC